MSDVLWGGWDPGCYSGLSLSRIVVDGANIIRPWGVEFADADSFFSLEEGVGWRSKVLSLTHTLSPDRHDVRATVELRSGCVELHLAEWPEGGVIRRECRLVCLTDCELFDFVLRFQFSADCLHEAYINGATLQHWPDEVYHQHAVDRAGVGNSFFSAWVEVVGSAAPGCMMPTMYVRGTHGGWVLHARMVPRTWEREVVRLCSSYFGTRPLPESLGRWLLAVPVARRHLWLRGERRPYRNRLAKIFSPSAYPIVQLREGTALAWSTRFTIKPPHQDA